MSQFSKFRRVPHNPGVRDLVEGKNFWSEPGATGKNRNGFPGWHERGYLPHCDKPGLKQFVTFHLADSFPAALRSEWEYLAGIEDDHERRLELEAYLDRGRGQCYLRRADIAQIVEDNFRQFAGQRYALLAWCIMPNHVHVLFETGSVSMSETIKSWKKHTSRLANQRLGRRGGFWAIDYFDTYMRNGEHEQRTIRYIENNPTRAGLVREPVEWKWSSARFRDEFGNLKLD